MSDGKRTTHVYPDDKICPTCEAQQKGIPPGFHWDGSYTWEGQPCYRSFDECPWAPPEGFPPEATS